MQAIRIQDIITEKGLLLNEGELGIIDQYGKPVPDIWDITRYPQFSLNIDWFKEE